MTRYGETSISTVESVQLQIAPDRSTGVHDAAGVFSWHWFVGGPNSRFPAFGVDGNRDSYGCGSIQPDVLLRISAGVTRP